MYTVYLTDYNSTPTEYNKTIAHDKLYIYDPITDDDGLVLTEPNLHIEASKAGSFTCTLPPTNYGYLKSIRGVTRVVVEKNNKVIFMGRVTSDDEDTYGDTKIVTEGALAYLNDSITEKKVFVYKTLFELLDYIFTNHNSKFPNEPWKQFHLTEENCKAKFVGRDNTDITSDKLTSYSINFDKSMELVLELVELAEGAIKIEYNETYGYWDVYVYDKNAFPVNESQPIELGLNIIDMLKTNEFNDICTAVAPFGGDLIQESKEIGEAVAGFQNNSWDSGINDPPATSGEPRPNPDAISRVYPNAIYVRDKNDPNGAYTIYNALGAGYWVITFNVVNYNLAHPTTPLSKLFVSWRGYEFETHSGEPAPEGMIEDCAWRIYDSSGNTIGYHEYGSDAGFKSAINEEIDFNDPQYIGATLIVMSGWGGIIKPLIRRDAIIIEENDRLSIEKCETFDEGPSGLRHAQGSPYLYSNKLIASYGLIEKKVEYEIEDNLIPVSDWSYPYSGDLGTVTKTTGVALGYDVGDGTDTESNKGDYKIIPFGDVGYSCIEYVLPDLDNPKRPRGVFVSCRMHSYPNYSYDNKTWLVNGMYAVYDSSNQLLAYKSAEEKMFTSIKNEFIDLSDPKYYGAKYIRVGGWGGSIPTDVIPSDDEYSRNRLMEQAKLYLTDYQWEKITMEISAVDLSMTSDEWDSLEICTNVVVMNGIFGRATYMPLTALDIQLDAIENNRVKIGFNNDELLSTQLAKNNRLTSILESIEERRKKNGN